MNKYKGEISRKFGDKERVFRLTFDNIVQIEHRTGKSVMDVARSIAERVYIPEHIPPYIGEATNTVFSLSFSTSIFISIGLPSREH